MRLTLMIVLWFGLSISAQAQQRWYGRYVFEMTGFNITRTRSEEVREFLDVSRDGSQIVAVFSVSINDDLLDYSERWIGHDFEDSISFTYDHCLTTGGTDDNEESPPPQQKKIDGSCKDNYERGAPMLTIGYKTGSGNQHILVTKFQEFMPAKPMGTAKRRFKNSPETHPVQ